MRPLDKARVNGDEVLNTLFVSTWSSSPSSSFDCAWLRIEGLGLGLGAHVTPESLVPGLACGWCRVRLEFGGGSGAVRVVQKVPDLEKVCGLKRRSEGVKRLEVIESVLELVDVPRFLVKAFRVWGLGFGHGLGAGPPFMAASWPFWRESHFGGKAGSTPHEGLGAGDLSGPRTRTLTLSTGLSAVNGG